jgi:hypothetical protein
MEDKCTSLVHLKVNDNEKIETPLSRPELDTSFKSFLFSLSVAFRWNQLESCKMLTTENTLAYSIHK